MWFYSETVGKDYIGYPKKVLTMRNEVTKIIHTLHNQGDTTFYQKIKYVYSVNFDRNCKFFFLEMIIYLYVCIFFFLI